MLYFLHGTDSIKSFDKSTKLVDAMLAKKPDASLFKLGTDNWQDSELQELIGGQGLFSQKYIVTMSRLLEDKTIAETVLGLLTEIAESDNIFIWTEEKVDAKTLKKIEKCAEKVQTQDVASSSKGMPPTAFPLTDAIGARNKKKAWLLFTDLISKIPAEEMHGTIVWLFKSIALAQKSKTAEDSGMKPFVFSKSQKFGANFSGKEIDDLYFNLVQMSHDARRGKGDLKISLEKFILGL